MHTTVLYHNHCPDGFGAALACYLTFGAEAQYLPVTYNQPVPEIPPAHHVMIVDFSYDAATLRALHAKHRHVVILDHHKSAQADLQPLLDQHLPGLTGWFDLEESGATLAWKYLHAGDLTFDAAEAQMPRLFHYLRDRDLWQWQMRDSKEVSAVLWSEERTFSRWTWCMEELETVEGAQQILREGTAILRYQGRLIEEQAARAVYGNIGGYPVPIVNTTTLFSEVGDYLCSQEPPPLFVAYYFDRSSTQRQWGLRGWGKVDLSRVAQQYGGGGHFSAAGFVTDISWRGEQQNEETEGQ